MSITTKIKRHQQQEVAAYLCKEPFVCGGWVVGRKVGCYQEVLGMHWQLQHIWSWRSRCVIMHAHTCTHTHARTHTCTRTRTRTHTRKRTHVHTYTVYTSTHTHIRIHSYDSTTHCLSFVCFPHFPHSPLSPLGHCRGTTRTHSR